MFMEAVDFVEEFENISAEHEYVKDFADRRVRQLASQYQIQTGKLSFVARIPAEGFDRWLFADGNNQRNAFDAVEYMMFLIQKDGVGSV